MIEKKHFFNQLNLRASRLYSDGEEYPDPLSAARSQMGRALTSEQNLHKISEKKRGIGPILSERWAALALLGIAVMLALPGTSHSPSDQR